MAGADNKCVFVYAVSVAVAVRHTGAEAPCSRRAVAHRQSQPRSGLCSDWAALDMGCAGHLSAAKSNAMRRRLRTVWTSLYQECWVCCLISRRVLVLRCGWGATRRPQAGRAHR
eukprot:3135091-Rhodomonas_salina.2